jgi:TusA-related sulfurtransferase
MTTAMIEAVPMAKRKAAKAKPASVLLVVRCSPAFKAWIEEFAAEERLTPSLLVEHALVEKAERKGRKAAPAR